MNTQTLPRSWPSLMLCTAVLLLSGATLQACAHPQTAGAGGSTSEQVASAPAAPASTRAWPALRVSADEPLLPAADCPGDTSLSLLYDRASHSALVADTDGLGAKLPPGWSVEVERRDMVVVRGPDREHGVRPVFELYITPRCPSAPDFTHPVMRVAARAMDELLAPADTLGQLATPRGHAILLGPATVWIADMNVDTPEGPRLLDVLSTFEVAGSASDQIAATAACPKPEPTAQAKPSPCTQAYLAMLQSLNEAVRARETAPPP